MNSIDQKTINILKRYVPDYFINERMIYFDLLENSKKEFPSSNWDVFIDYIEKHPEINPRQIFIDNDSYNSPTYFEKCYEKLLNIKFDNLNGTYYFHWFVENPVFPAEGVSRSRYETVQEGLNIASRCTKSPKNIKILDIGGGYGRLAEFFLRMFPNCTYYMADTFVLSTISAEWYLSHVVNPNQIKYLNHVGLERRLNFISTDQIKDYSDFDMIANVHSMDEMDADTIQKIIDIISYPQRAKSLYLKNHFRTYGLAGNQIREQEWGYMIPKNKYSLMESIPASEEMGFVNRLTYERFYISTEKK
jgi:hypothetical protein